MARRGTFAPLPCASAYCQKNFKKTMKNRENRLDISKIFFYDNKARVEGRTAPGEYCDEPGDCSKEVTSGEYVR